MRSISFQPPEIPQVNLNEDLITDILRMTIATPMVGGGIEAGEIDSRQPVRVSSIRGNLRYWWRMLNLDNEANIWGSTTSKSKVLLRLRNFRRCVYVNMAGILIFLDTGLKHMLYLQRLLTETT